MMHRREMGSSRSTSTFILKVLAWSTALLLVGSSIGIADPAETLNDIQCRGVYDSKIFEKLDHVCVLCSQTFSELQLHDLCRKACFTSDFFNACLDTLMVGDEKNYHEMARRLAGVKLK